MVNRIDGTTLHHHHHLLRLRLFLLFVGLALLDSLAFPGRHDGISTGARLCPMSSYYEPRRMRQMKRRRKKKETKPSRTLALSLSVSSLQFYLSLSLLLSRIDRVTKTTGRPRCFRRHRRRFCYRREKRRWLRLYRSGHWQKISTASENSPHKGAHSEKSSNTTNERVRRK